MQVVRNCILCGENGVKNLDTVKKEKLIYLYRKNFRIDVSYLIDSDIELFECQNCGILFYFPLISGDKKFYEQLQKYDWYYMKEKEEYIYAKKFIDPNDKILEVGCGEGWFAEIIGSKNYIGLELNEKAVLLAQKKGLNVFNISLENFAKENSEAFDVVVSFQVLEHVPNPKEFFEAKILSVKRNGKIIISVPNDDSFVKYITNHALNMPPHHLTRWKTSVFEFLAKKYNLKILDIYYEKLQPIHSLLFLKTFFENLFLPPKLIDVSIRRRIVSRFSYILASLFVKNLKPELLPHGASLIVVMQKA
jgi:2-polyprenyl-3-methyl-5-hydroxy-6-metoxy-1,4-benzoquinol methylase